MDPHNMEELNYRLEVLSSRVETQNSLLYTAVRGILTGIASFVGATIAATVLITILNSSVQGIEDVPFLKNIVDSINSRSIGK